MSAINPNIYTINRSLLCYSDSSLWTYLPYFPILVDRPPYPSFAQGVILLTIVLGYALPPLMRGSVQPLLLPSLYVFSSDVLTFLTLSDCLSVWRVLSVLFKACEHCMVSEAQRGIIILMGCGNPHSLCEVCKPCPHQCKSLLR